MKDAQIFAAVTVLLIHSAAFAQQTTSTPTSAVTPATVPPPAPKTPTPVPAPQAGVQPTPAKPPAPPPKPPAPALPPKPTPAAPPIPPPPPPPAAVVPVPYYPPYPYGPPPGYSPPPSYGPPVGYGPPPSYYYPGGHFRPGIYRPFTISLGLGIGNLSMPGMPRENDAGTSYHGRIGFGITRNWIIFLGVDGTSVAMRDYDVSQSNYLIGAQYFVLPRLYVRAGLGLASVTENTNLEAYQDSGQAYLAALGFELIQGDSVAVGLEWSSSVARFAIGNYYRNGINLALSFY